MKISPWTMRARPHGARVCLAGVVAHVRRSYSIPAAHAAIPERTARRPPREIRRIRRKVGLRKAAARLTGGGHNAFSRYERCEVTPLPAVVKLFRLLDRRPELLEEIA